MRRNVCIFITVISTRRTGPTYINLCVELYVWRSHVASRSLVGSQRELRSVEINLTSPMCLHPASHSVRVLRQDFDTLRIKFDFPER